MKAPGAARRHSLYIENRTRQFHDFGYRLPSETHRRSETIDPGTERRIYQETTLAVLRAILDQHRMYGIVPTERVGAGFVGLCYRFDPPVDYEEEDRLAIARQQAKEAAKVQAIEQAALAAIGDAPPAPARRRNASPTRDRVVAAMVRDYPTAAALDDEKQTQLMERYKVGTSTIRAAKEIALSKLNHGQTRTTDK
jgi:hypothetical protein